MSSQTTGQLLSRTAFKSQVFARDQGSCVFCGLTAVDAHHIVERKLWDDAGYYLDNGAAVCEQHHWKCETTEFDLEYVRQAAGIERVMLPESINASWRIDKWGNRIWPSGMRSWGMLENDTGARKALAQGGFLGRMMPSDYTEDAGVV